MPNATRSPRKDASPSGTLLEELAREVFALRAELTSLREQLATEVRTRRLVVVDEDGFEGVTAEAVHQGGEVTAWCLAEEGEPDGGRALRHRRRTGKRRGVRLRWRQHPRDVQRPAHR